MTSPRSLPGFTQRSLGYSDNGARVITSPPYRSGLFPPPYSTGTTSPGNSLRPYEGIPQQSAERRGADVSLYSGRYGSEDKAFSSGDERVSLASPVASRQIGSAKTIRSQESHVPQSSLIHQENDMDKNNNLSTSADKSKRKKKAVSCEGCRRRKLKCDRGWPCGACRDRDEAHLCTWEGGTQPQSTGRDQGNVPLMQRLERMELLLADIASRVGLEKPRGSSSHQEASNAVKENAQMIKEERKQDKKSTLSSTGLHPSKMHNAFLTSSSKAITNEDAKCEFWTIMKVLPDADAVRRMCRYYFDEIGWMYYAVDEADLWTNGLCEHEELRRMNSEQRNSLSEAKLRRNMQFLSLLLCMCGLTLVYSDVDEFADVITHVGSSPAHGFFLDASQRVLAASNPFEEPTLCSLRVLLLQSWSISCVRALGIGQSILASAAYVMYSLGLDVEPPATMPLAQRRDRVRLFHSLALLDWFGAGTSKKSYLVREEPHKHPYLFGRRNFRDGMENDEESFILPDMWVKLEMARINRRAADRTAMPEEEAYATTLQLQEELNEIVADLPPEFEAEVEMEREHLDHAALHRIAVLAMVANQLISLHKRYYIQGWLDPKYESSRHICFTSARRICLLFRKLFSYNIPINVVMTMDMSQIHRLMDTRQKFNSRLWFFAYTCVGACLLLQHHYALMDVHPHAAGPNADQVRADVFEDLRITRRILLALSARSEVARSGVMMLSRPILPCSKDKSSNSIAIHDPTQRHEGENEDVASRKRQADLAQDLRSITEVDSFASKRIKMHGEEGMNMYRKRHNRSSGSNDPHYNTSATPTSSTPQSVGGGYNNRPSIIPQNSKMPIQSLQGQDDASGGGGNAGSSNFDYAALEALLESTLSTDIGIGAPLAPEQSFERQADRMGANHTFLPNMLLFGSLSPFTNSYVGGDSAQPNDQDSTVAAGSTPILNSTAPTSVLSANGQTATTPSVNWF